jgi:glycosyltransferase involved in cell wall biosynthesis
MFTILFPFVDREKTWPWGFSNGTEGPKSWRRWLRNRYYDWEWRTRMDSYAVKTSNSYFTAQWVLKRYGAQCQVHYPPSQNLTPAPTKRDAILSVGRFSVYKNQLEMMSAFRQLTDLSDTGWAFHCVGAVDETHSEGRLYYDAVRSLANNGSAHVIGNLDLTKLKDLYQESKIFWHAAGYPHDQNQVPHVMEHFGIVTVEAMSAGCVPIVINKGGQPEIVQHGVNGFLWTTLEELKGYTCLLAKDDALRTRMSHAAIERARLFSTSQFIKRFYELAPDLAPTH